MQPDQAAWIVVAVYFVPPADHPFQLGVEFGVEEEGRRAAGLRPVATFLLALFVCVPAIAEVDSPYVMRDAVGKLEAWPSEVAGRALSGASRR